MKKTKNIKKVRLAVVGALGRMGTRILSLAHDDPRFQIIAGVEHPSNEGVGRFVPGGFAPVVGRIEEVLAKTDVVIDFSSAGSVLSNAKKAAKAKSAIVIGTTGLKSAGERQLKKLSRRIPIVLSPNMSVGVNLLFRLVQKAAATLKNYDIEIVEAHHNLKKDSPSGTAVKLAEVATEASGRSRKDWVYGRHGIIGARKKKEIGVFSIRAGDIVGDHSVLLSSGGERLELVHRAHSRDAFASGAVEAAAWVAKKRPGLYSMFDVLRI